MGFIAIILVGGIMMAIPAAITMIIIACVKSGKKEEKQFYIINGEQVELPPKPLKPPKPPKPPREKLGASAIMLLIGTSFIVLGAITFVVANWVKMNAIGRVFALLAESALGFGISVLLKKVVKLNRTSMAFYMIGSIIAVIAFITAGYYKLLGDWFSIDGDGFALLYSVSALMVASASFAGNALYKNKAFNYIGSAFTSLAIVFLCIQPTESYEQFAPVIAFAQLIMTAIIHFLKPQKNTEMEKPVVLVGDISAIIYQIIAGIYVLWTTFDPTIYTFLVLIILLAQLLVYGIFKNKKYMFPLFNLVGLYTGMIISCLAEEKIGTDDSLLLFSFITLVFCIVNRFIPKNLVSCKVITLIGAVIGSIVSLVAINSNNLWAGFIVPAITSVIIASYGLNQDKSIQTASGFAFPIIPFLMAVYLNSNFMYVADIGSDERITLAYGLLVLVYVLTAGFFVYLPKINFGFYAKHPVKSQAIIYTSMISATAVLLSISRYSQLFMIPVVLCIAHFIVSYSMSCNITATGSVIGFIFLINSVLKHYIDNDSDMRLYIMLGLFVVLVIISRIVFPDGFSVKENNRTLIDVILLSSWTAVIPFPIANRATFFLRTIALAVFIAGFVKRNTKQETACVLVSISATIACFAFMTRPFLTPDSSMIASKVNIAIFALLGAAYMIIWKNNKSISKSASTIIFVISFISLMIDGLIFDNIASRIFVLAVTAGVLILSFFLKSKTWFTVSSVSLVVLTISSTYRYFNSAGWWIYLLIVGVIFITIASVNEICRKNGETMKSKVSKTFSDWTW